MTGLAISSLSVRRDGRAVVDRVEVAAEAGRITVLVGPNGAGKSTLLKAVLGLIPSEGGIVLDGVDLRAAAPRERARRIAYVPQRSQLAAALPVRTVVAAARYAHDGWLAGAAGAGAAAVDAALRAADVLDLAERAFNALSAGEQQRVLVARALATGAGCILMDEPTSSLDVGHALALLGLARRLAAEGRTLVVVLHHLDDARRLADHLVLLHQGRVLASGAPEAVLSAEPLAEAFHVAPVPDGAMGFRLLEGG